MSIRRRLRPRRRKRQEPSDTLEIHPSLKANEIQLRKAVEHSHDVSFSKETFTTGVDSLQVMMMYCSGMVDRKQMNSEALPAIRYWVNTYLSEKREATWTYMQVQTIYNLDQVVERVLEGQLVLLLEGFEKAYALDVSSPPHRQPEESQMETSVRGARDGFTEELEENVALVRKRLKNPSFCFEQFTLGTRSQTRVGLLYIRDIIHSPVLEEVKQKLNQIEVEAINSSAQLEQLISNTRYPLFPEFDFTGRPDFVMASLLRGRFCILVDGNPAALIAPVQLTEVLKSVEDLHIDSFFPTFEYLLRLLGLFLALFAPGLTVAIASFHTDQIPFPLLVTLVLSRAGVPFPPPMEALVMLVLFELFREAGLRMPSPIGQTLSVVGGLIIGDAAIRSGLTSPSMVVVIAVSAVATSTLVNQTLHGAVTLLRFAVLLLSSIFGLLGFFVALFMIILYLAQLRSFGIPYLAPLSPYSSGDTYRMLLSWKTLRRRPQLLKPQDDTRRPKERP
ncbi:spore germination protein [Kroppenstedtia pulmonis]|uniref:Spore germination protein n=1 Tax=Kroppenstedtia pulmonis TaxID=1380685 RepID=A0A7D3XRK4_9BACL|nr:spore germination protein [Kroppenstedtia pulmonis]QKG84328.1 spore germination protein [Kroppenstedtia pulmonis]